MLKDNIKRLRQERGMSQGDLADRVHVVRQTVSKWERGASVPDALTLAAVAEALDAPVAELLGEDIVGQTVEETAVEAALAHERIGQHDRRFDRLMFAAKWAIVGAVVVLCFFGVRWLADNTTGIYQGPVTAADNPNYLEVVYELDGKQESLKLYVDGYDFEYYEDGRSEPVGLDRVIACSGDSAILDALQPADQFNKEGSRDVLKERATDVIEEAGGKVLAYREWASEEVTEALYPESGDYDPTIPLGEDYMGQEVYDKINS
ncbi:helix-turn-helix transcriptional regulator [uncultured Adlercreutzia sp.]|uniref:helix-turn-helix transcriptional regulator n=1 Tax=uncultured Adlercreutzia sp. TaxID=875803 RepID=UPI0026F398E2|nr:helix-turn-helix transcriptional regulator [uncultured Adlercreutzia sp.]